MPSTAVERHSIADYRHALERVRAGAKRLREEHKEEFQNLARRGTQQITALGTGAMVGLVRGFWGDAATGDVHIPGIGVDFEVAGAVIGGVGAMAGVFGDASDHVNVAASVLTGIVVARETEKLVKAQNATKK